MSQPSPVRRLVSRCAASMALLLLLGTSAARAAAPAADPTDVSEWRGRYCTPLGCSGGAESALGNALGFAIAAGSVALLARRRRA